MSVSANIFYRKGVDRKASGSPWFIGYKKATLTLGWAVAFLMFMYLSVISDTDDRDNDTNHRHYNTDDTDYRFQHQILTFLF